MSENSLQPISLVLKPEQFLSEILVEVSGLRPVIAGSKLQAVPQIKFDTDLMKRVVPAATEDQEW
jgi:hypothetical protein